MLARGAWAAATGRRSAGVSAVRRALTEYYGARAVVLTDSGTSALVQALRLAGCGGTVALPGYSCVDLVAAARCAGVSARLYDIDPATLSPDLESLRGALRRGVDAVVIAHLFGFPADMRAVLELAAVHGVTVIEDAAQAAGATLRGRPAGGFGHLSVLSFGRGKGVTAGRGGALMAIAPAWEERVREFGDDLAPPDTGWTDLVVAAAQWALGRPGLYSIPASIPGLRLGEMVYHAAHEPCGMSRAAVAMLDCALARAESELARRRDNARHLQLGAARSVRLRTVTPLAAAAPGYLRFPVLDEGDRRPAPALGVLRGYPGTLADQPQLAPCLLERERGGLGAEVLGRSLFTLPTHGRLTSSDLVRLEGWMLAAPAVPAWAKRMRGSEW